MYIFGETSEAPGGNFHTVPGSRVWSQRSKIKCGTYFLWYEMTTLMSCVAYGGGATHVDL